MIRLEDVAKTYKKASVPALTDITLTVADGEFAFLIGPSGSGKSTLLSLLLREEKATSGQVLVADHDLSRLGAWKVARYRRELGCVFQDFQLLPNKSAAQNVAFALEVTGTRRSEIRPRVEKVLDEVGLKGKGSRRIERLSGGEQQRVAIARALVNEPKLLLADEPTGNLDPETARGIMDLLAAINSRGTTVLVATHDVAMVDSMQRRVLELDHGYLVRDEVGGLYLEEGVR